ncbi:MAG: hypothetical protein GTN99_05195 [Candidatus Dadabacteria bacterium]|nr:hypothetical protein [Candidatus Dadabacteria bacterium]
MRRDTSTFLKFSIPFFVVIGVLIWRLGPETGEKFPAYIVSEQGSVKDSKITKATSAIKETLVELDKRGREIKSELKPKPRPKTSINITSPKDGYRTQEGKTIAIVWRGENIPDDGVIQFNYMGPRGWSEPYNVDARNNTYYWQIPYGVKGYVPLYLSVRKYNENKWLSQVSVDIYIEEKKKVVVKRKPRISIISPEKGYKIYQGETLIIRWEAENIPSYKWILFNYKYAKGWSKASSIKPHKKSYHWKIPNDVAGWIELHLGVHEATTDTWIANDRVHINVKERRRPYYPYWHR